MTSARRARRAQAVTRAGARARAGRRARCCAPGRCPRRTATRTKVARARADGRRLGRASGAAILAANAALRSGVGKVCVATERSIAHGVALAVPEARVVAIRKGGRGTAALSDEADRFDALLMGPADYRSARRLAHLHARAAGAHLAGGARRWSVGPGFGARGANRMHRHAAHGRDGATCCNVTRSSSRRTRRRLPGTSPPPMAR